MRDRFRFRVWNEKERKFILDHNHPIGSDYFLVLDTEGKLLKIGMGDLNEEKQCSWGNIEEYQGIVEQCTGLKDKNGRLIYEGDIVQVYEAKKPYIRGVVKYGKFMFSKCAEYSCEHLAFFIAAEFNNYIHCTGYSLDIEYAQYEVIGNIHENPEILETGK